MPPTPPRQPAIAVIGAGPGGLSTAYFLKKRGYKDVMVFDKLGRVGGLALSITAGYQSFDLGANYITPAYWETWKLARSVGSGTIKAKSYLQANVDDHGKVAYHSIANYVFTDPETGEKIPPMKIIGAIFKYARKRWKLRRLIDGPTLAPVEHVHELAVSFQKWLDDNDIGCLAPMCSIPITMMGYGFLHEIPAVYALKFLSLPNFLTMVARGVPVLGEWFPFPRRFRHGFQRMWEQVSWGLNVRMNVTIKSVTRNDGETHPIEIKLSHPDRIFHEREDVDETLYFDYLVLACPLTKAVLEPFLEMSNKEHELFDQVHTFSFCHTTLHCVQKGDEKKWLKLKAPVLCVTPFMEKTIGKPWAVVQLWGDDTNLIQFYTRVKDSIEESDVAGQAEFRNMVFRNIRTFLERIGGEPAGLTDEKDVRWRTYHRWPYFGQVSVEAMEKGFFRELGDLQGEQNTYYAGGVTNFELIEPIVRHSKNVARRIDEKVRAEVDSG